MRDINRNQIRNFWGNDDFEWIYYPPEGKSGGLLFVWDCANYEFLIDNLQSPCSITIVLRTRADGYVWMLTNVYGPAERGGKEVLWDEFWFVRGLWQLPWILGGDFNCIIYILKKNKISRANSDMKQFDSFITEAEFVDLLLHGGKYTWTSKRFNPTLTRIDRFSFSDEWLIKKSVLSRATSNHALITLQLGPNKISISLFRLEIFWINEGSFFEVLCFLWNKFDFRGSSSFIFFQRNYKV